MIGRLHFSDKLGMPKKQCVPGPYLDKAGYEGRFSVCVCVWGGGGTCRVKVIVL